MLISRLWVNASPVGKLSGQHFGLSDAVAAASADTSETFPLIRLVSMSILSIFLALQSGRGRATTFLRTSAKAVGAARYAAARYAALN